MKHKNPYAGQGAGISQQQRQRQQGDYTQANQIEAQPIQQNPLYNSFLTAGTDATNNAFNGSEAAQRLRANAAGFGYAQPVVQGATEQLEGQRAGALGALPSQSAAQAEPYAQAQAGMLENEGNALGGEATGYFNTGSQAYNQQQQMNQGLWGALANAGMLGVSAIPGLGVAGNVLKAAAGGAS